jgi:HAD superfamily hydrolase (TIGR01509 family)
VNRFAAVVFDMDGVLIDSEPLHFDVIQELLADEGQSYSHAENEEFIGTTTDAFWSAMIPRKQLALPRAYYEAKYDAGVLRMLSRTWPAAPGAKELVRHLALLGVRLAVASSSKRNWVAATLRSIGLSDAFETIAAGDEVQHGKPDPEIYVLAAELLGVPPEECVAIEDSPNGVLSATAAGMAVLGVRTPYTAHLRLDGARRIVDSLAELDLTGDPFADW